MKCLLRIIILGGLVSVGASPGFTQLPSAKPTRPPVSGDPQTFPLWQKGAPGAVGNEESDIPTLTYYPAVAPLPVAIIVAPGGGYNHFAMNHEGRQVANFLNAAGITAFVLKYRLGIRYHHPIQLEDAQRALRLVRARAAEFHIKPDRIGMLGFSAGGHLTALAETHFDSGNPSAADPIDRESSRPDFAVLGYALISVTAPYSNKVARELIPQRLLDNPHDPKQLEDLSADLHVTPQTPPTFLFCTSEDGLVPSENSVSFYLELHKAKVPAELHIFQKGRHGLGMDLGDPGYGQWPTLLLNWLRGLGLTEKYSGKRRGYYAAERIADHLNSYCTVALA